MASAVAVRRPSTKKRTATPPASSQAKMVIVTYDRGVAVTVPFAPNATTESALAAAFTEVARPGRTPLLASTGLSLPKLAFELDFKHRDWTLAIEQTLDDLKRIVRSGQQRVYLVNLGWHSRSIWWITDMTITSDQRAPGSNDVSRARVSITATYGGDASHTGPVNGGGSSQTPAKTRTRTILYTVKHGDTVTSIATKVLHNSRRWGEIVGDNGLRDPRKLRVGQVLKIKVP